MARPGIMVYFDMMGPLSKLPDADKGRLFWAMLEYGKNGIVPEFDGLALALAWEFVKPKIDKDSEEYNRTILKRQYATFCRDRKKKGEPEISFDEWMMTIDDQSYHMISHDIKWYPTTTATATTNTITTTITAAAATTTEPEISAAATDSEVKLMGGTLGKGVVLLSDDQVEALLDRMGLEVFDYYVDKLSNFILRNNAKVKNHYETILKWWQQDSAVPGNKRNELPKGASGFGQAEIDALRKQLTEEL